MVQPDSPFEMGMYKCIQDTKLMYPCVQKVENVEVSSSTSVCNSESAALKGCQDVLSCARSQELCMHMTTSVTFGEEALFCHAG